MLDIGLRAASHPHLPISAVIPLNVLILENCEFDRHRIRKDVQISGLAVNIDEVARLHGLKSMISDKKYDVVILSDGLPDGSAREALSTLQKDELNSDAAKVLISRHFSDLIVGLGTQNIHYFSKDQLGRGMILQHLFHKVVLN